MITPFIFADDTNLFISGKDPNALISILNEELKNANKLSLNAEKTKYIVFSKLKWYDKYAIRFLRIIEQVKIK